jgi:hypothetical protein
VPANLSINATPAANYHFVNWTVTTGNCSVNNTTSPNTQVQVLNSSLSNVQAYFGQYISIAVNYPINNTLNQTYATLNFTVTNTSGVNVSSCWWTLNHTTSLYPLANCSNSSIALNSLPPGNYTLTVFANNTANETVNATSWFVTQTSDTWFPGLYIGAGVLAIGGAAVFYMARKNIAKPH